MMAHHGGKDFRREFQVGRIEVAANRGGIFRDERQGFEQFGVGLGAQLSNFCLDLGAALIRRQDDEVLAQLNFVVRKGDRNGRRSEYTMASCHTSAVYSINLKRYNLLSLKSSQQPTCTS